MLFKTDYHAVAIIGINKEGLAVYESFIETDSIKSVVMIRPDEEGLKMLMQIPQLDLVINTTQDPATAEALRRIDLNGAEIISGLSAKILLGHRVSSVRQPVLTAKTAGIRSGFSTAFAKLPKLSHLPRTKRSCSS